MRKIIISGGPHTGKTTLFKALQQEFDGCYFVPEPATEVINEEYAKEKEIEGYVGKFPWNNYPEFGPLVMAKSLELERNIPEDIEIAILDRSLIDTVAYAKLNGCEFMLDKLNECIEKAGYEMVLFCEFVGEYTKTEYRSEDYEGAVITHETLKKNYKEANLKFVDLRAISVEERIELIRAAL